MRREKETWRERWEFHTCNIHFWPQFGLDRRNKKTMSKMPIYWCLYTLCRLTQFAPRLYMLWYMWITWRLWSQQQKKASKKATEDNSFEINTLI
mmetsp:Transcript_14377/g.25584  ORF Transcript_14377/g.25584 Transcript_14377/m.25584 type:complete len:94 (-) Transcript_14377:163-444(-)